MSNLQSVPRARGIAKRRGLLRSIWGNGVSPCLMPNATQLR